MTTSPEQKPLASLQVAYLIDQCPAVSHTFIKREIQALERQGVSVSRFALRGCEGELVDDDDRRERERTRYVLQHGLTVLALAVMGRAVLAPGKLLAAAALALRLARVLVQLYCTRLRHHESACPDGARVQGGRSQLRCGRGFVRWRWLPFEMWGKAAIALRFARGAQGRQWATVKPH